MEPMVLKSRISLIGNCLADQIFALGPISCEDRQRRALPYQVILSSLPIELFDTRTKVVGT